jgi:hypothetical protein
MEKPTGDSIMNCTEVNELVKELAAVIRFHELGDVDSKAAELLDVVDTMFEEITVDDCDNTELIESIRQANLVETTR